MWYWILIDISCTVIENNLKKKKANQNDEFLNEFVNEFFLSYV